MHWCGEETALLMMLFGFVGAARHQVIRLLVWIGFVRIVTTKKIDVSVTPYRYYETPPRVRWPFHVSPWHVWKAHFWPAVGKREPIFGVFRNRPGFVKWEKGRLLPRRWGIRILGFEFGDRG